MSTLRVADGIARNATVAGTISISGKAGDFTGQCQAMDPNAAAKF